MTRLRLSVLALAATLSLAACDAQQTSLFDPARPDGTAPVVASVVSDDPLVLAGIDVLTITGSNFSSTPSDNRVSFDDGAGARAFGTVLEASPTQLRVRVPNLPNPNLRLRVAVPGSTQFSNAVARPLLPAAVQFGALVPGEREELFGMTSTAEGVLYASLTRQGISQGVVRFDLAGNRTPFFTSPFVWSDLAVLADGTLFGVRSLRALFRLPEGGTQQTVVALPVGVTLTTIAASPQGLLYAGGSNTAAPSASLYRISPAGAATAYPFPNQTAQAMVVFQSSLYVLARGETQAVWRFPIAQDGALGAGSIFLALAPNLPTGVTATDLEFSADGTMYLLTNGVNPVLQVTPLGVVSPLYPGVLPSPATSAAWGASSILYIARASIVVPGLPTIPAGLSAVETRRPRR